MIKPFLLASLLFLGFLSGCSNNISSNQEASQIEVVEVAPDVLPQTIIELVADSDNILVSDLTNSRHEVEYKEYDFGVMVEAIDGLRADANHYWALYVNDAYGEAGASQLKVNQGDRVKWVYEEIK